MATFAALIGDLGSSDLKHPATMKLIDH